MNCSTPGFPVHHKPPKLAQTHVYRVGDAIQPTHPLLSPSLSAFSLSRIRVFSSGSVLCVKFPKYWSFSFSISHSKDYTGLISFSIDWLNLLAVQRTLKSLLQHHSSKASFLQCSAFFVVQISHLYMTTGKIYCCCSVTPSCLTLCNPMNCSTTGLPVHHQFLELAQTHVH